MLITVELLLADNPRRSLMTIEEMDISSLPGVEAVTECYTERFATIPPGMWYRYYQGQRWRIRSIPGPFFSVPQSLAEYTGSQTLSGKPQPVCFLVA